MTPDTAKQWYRLVKCNFQNLDPATRKVMVTVRGLARAQQMVDALSKQLTPEERQAGFDVCWEEGQEPSTFKKRGKPPNQRPDRRP